MERRLYAQVAPAKGFSLLELLVVIAVIALLGSIVISVAGNIREHAAATKSLGNLRALGTALKLYVGENNGRLPTLNRQNDDPSGGPNMANSWMAQVREYVNLPGQVPDSVAAAYSRSDYKLPIIFYCPNAERSHPWGDYGANYEFIMYRDYTDPDRIVSVYNTPNLEKKVLIASVAGLDGNNEPTGSTDGSWLLHGRLFAERGSTGAYGARPYDRNAGKCNVLMGDGSCAQIVAAELSRQEREDLFLNEIN
ncbi:type II secretion system protein [Ruficoccus amylovorans]|uniref:Type II secretion system protein n=1 Tax=Ruficoccus amylovorans TaxID=1804625 RepID=A0A842HF28_9BACT|nr:type II secretion system protein [Ruficoccus amylovorans]MBC2594177.1 type II secretion system protein [Ruficoccus amylovorans]